MCTRTWPQSSAKGSASLSTATCSVGSPGPLQLACNTTPP